MPTFLIIKKIHRELKEEINMTLF